MVAEAELNAVGSKAEDCGADMGALMAGTLVGGIAVDTVVVPVMTGFKAALLLLMTELGMAPAPAVPVDPYAPVARTPGKR